MNPNDTFIEASLTLDLDLAPRPLRLPAGAAIFATRGTVWITQERLCDDIILGRGERFDVKGSDLVLASAIKGTAAILIVQPAVARKHRQRDIYDFARERAIRLRGEAIGDFGKLVSATAAAWFARLRATLIARPSTVSH